MGPPNIISSLLLPNQTWVCLPVTVKPVSRHQVVGKESKALVAGCQVGSSEQLVLKTSGGSDGKESACNAGDSGSIPGLGRSPGDENGNPLQYSCLENPMGQGVWQGAVHGVIRVGDG